MKVFLHYDNFWKIHENLISHHLCWSYASLLQKIIFCVCVSFQAYTRNHKNKILTEISTYTVL